VRPAAAGLRFIGYDIRPSLIGHMAKLSKRMAKRIARELSAGQPGRLGSTLPAGLPDQAVTSR